MSSLSSIDLKALEVLIKAPVSEEMIYKIVVTTLQILPCVESKKTIDVKGDGQKALPSLVSFLTKLVRYTHVYTGTLLATLVYLDRLKSKLPKDAHGLPCTRHRILLSCLIISSKFHNDSSPKNKHWAKYTDGLFTTKDINLMERQLIFLLNWDLKVTNAEMVSHLKKFLDPIAEELENSQKLRRYLQQKNQQIQKQLNSTSTPVSPESISRSSSTSSSLSLRYRGGSICSISSHSSIEESPLVDSYKKRDIQSSHVDPYIELAAQQEENELNKFINSITNSVHC